MRFAPFSLYFTPKRSKMSIYVWNFTHKLFRIVKMCWFYYHCVPYWLISRPYDLIFALCTQLTPFKTICPSFTIVYPIGSFQDHLTSWLLSRPFDIILSLCTELTPFKTIWSDIIIVYTIDSFQDHLTQFYYCGPNWLLSRPFDIILSLCTKLTPFKTIWLIFAFCTQLTPFKSLWPDFCIVYQTASFQHHLTKYYHCVPNWLLSRPFDLIL